MRMLIRCDDSLHDDDRRAALDLCDPVDEFGHANWNRGEIQRNNRTTHLLANERGRRQALTCFCVVFFFFFFFLAVCNKKSQLSHQEVTGRRCDDVK